MENDVCRRRYRDRVAPRLLTGWMAIGTVLAVASAFFNQAAMAQPLQRPPFPTVRLPNRMQGEAAIDALDGQLPAMAAFYRRSPEELRAALRRDKSLWVDPSGRLYYVCDWTGASADEFSSTNSAPALGQLAPLDQTFLLHSKPGSTKTIFLDFDGHTISGAAWNANNGGADIVAPAWDTDGNPSSFGNGELTAIQQIWLRVAEDYAPYDVDVTTEYPGEAAITRGSSGDLVYGTRALISPIGFYFGNPGGIAYVGVFDDVGDFYKPALVFPENLNNNEKNIAEAISHEVGHNLGLNHDGQDAFNVHTEYYGGQGNWAPIMGVGYGKPITQWSRGDYPFPSNTEDDLTIITQNGLSYRIDDFGNNTASATPLSGSIIVTNGIIERTTDKDFFSFQCGAGLAQITVSLWERGPNLHLFVSLFDGAGVLLTNREVADTSSGTQPVSISRAVGSGVYYLSVEGISSGDPLASGYPDYASLGEYTVNVSLPPIDPWVPTAPGVYSWTNPANWSVNVPNAADVNARINNNITGDQVITLDAPIIIGQLVLGDADSSHAFTLEDGAGGPLTFNAVAGDASIVKTTGVGDVIAASIALQDRLVISNGSAIGLTLSGPITGASGLVKSGNGPLLLAGTNTYSGDTIVSNGALALAATGSISNSPTIRLNAGATFDATSIAGGFVLSSNQTAGGGGVFIGDVTVDGGANAWPGAGGTARTLTFSNNLTFPGNGQMTFSLARTNTIGGGTNDLIDVVGTLSLAGSNSFAVNLLDGQLASGETYTVLKYGSIAGGASNLTYAPVTTRYTFAPDDSVPGEIRLMVSGGGPSAITWRGDGLANAWNVAGSSNWFNGAATDQFFQFDTVTFDDSGSNSPSVNLTDTLTPAAVTVNASKSYTFAGGGKLSGATSLTKLGTGTLTLNNANDFSGAITVGGGVLKPANISALGATNPVGVQSGGTLDLNALNLSPHSIAVQGSGSSGSGAIINSSGASQLNALQFVALTGDATFGGTGRWDIRANPNGALAGNGFKLSKMGANEVWLVGLGTTGLGDVEVRQGLLGIQSSTTLGNSANALALWPNATLVFFDNTTNVLNKVLRATNAIVRNDSANNVFLGPITLNNSNFFNVAASLDLRGPIGGSGTMAKAGSGTLVLRGTNDFSGSLYLDTGSTGASDGMVRLVGPKPLTSAASIILRNNNGGSSTLQLDGSPGSITITSLFRINCRNNTTPAIQNVAGNNTLGGPIQIDVGGTTVLYLCDSGQLTFGGTQQYVGSLTGGRTYTFGGSGNHVINGSILNSVNGAPISVAKTGSGTMTLNVASTYASTTSITQGVVQVNATGAFGTSAITCNSGGNTARIVLSNGVSIANHITAITVNPGVALGLLMVNDNTTATFSGRLTFNAAASSGGHVAGPTTSGVLNLNGVINSGAGYPLIVRLGNVRFAGGGSYPEIQPRANITSLGANNGIAMNALMDIAGNGSPTTPTAFDLNGFNQTLAGLKNAVNAGNAAWVTNSGATTNTLTLNLGATNQSFGGSIVGRIALTLNSGTQTLTKSGPALNGLYTFNGNTTINGGTLVLGAGMTLPNTPLITLGPGATLDVSASGLTLGPGQRIAGNGSVAGNFIANGTVSPGTSIGALTFNNNLSLAGATLIEITHTGPTNDVVNVTATLTRGGVLTVTNIGPALAAGDSFKLFNAGLLAGSFGSMTLPSLGSGLRWNTNQFPANSTISVYAVASPQITPSLNGTNLVLQFPTEIGVNYVLQSTTNLIAPTIWTSQQTNAGNGSIVSVQVPINAAESQKYFRLLVY